MRARAWVVGMGTAAPWFVYGGRGREFSDVAIVVFCCVR